MSNHLPPRLSPQQRKFLFAMGFEGLQKPDIYDALHFLLIEKKVLIESGATDNWNEWFYKVSVEDLSHPMLLALDSSRIDKFFSSKHESDLAAFDAIIEYLDIRLPESEDQDA